MPSRSGRFGLVLAINLRLAFNLFEVFFTVVWDPVRLKLVLNWLKRVCFYLDIFAWTP